MKQQQHSRSIGRLFLIAAFAVGVAEGKSLVGDTIDTVSGYVSDAMTKGTNAVKTVVGALSGPSAESKVLDYFAGFKEMGNSERDRKAMVHKFDELWESGATDELSADFTHNQVRPLVDAHAHKVNAVLEGFVELPSRGTYTVQGTTFYPTVKLYAAFALFNEAVKAKKRGDEAKTAVMVLFESMQNSFIAYPRTEKNLRSKMAKELGTTLGNADGNELFKSSQISDLQLWMRLDLTIYKLVVALTRDKPASESDFIVRAKTLPTNQEKLRDEATKYFQSKFAENQN